MSTITDPKQLIKSEDSLVLQSKYKTVKSSEDTVDHRSFTSGKGCLKLC